jgi:hypothetical protein
MLNDILKREYSFQGFVMSDAFATMSTLSAVAGLDMTMPGNIVNYNTSYFGGNLTDYVNEGYISIARLDDMVTRILAAWYFLHQDEQYPATNFNSLDQNDKVNNKHVNVQADHYRIVREIGAAGTVLLKNTNGALPLNKPRNMVLIGSDAGPGKSGPNEFLFGGGVDGILAEGWGSGCVGSEYSVSFLRTNTDEPCIELAFFLTLFRLSRLFRSALAWMAAVYPGTLTTGTLIWLVIWRLARLSLWSSPALTLVRVSLLSTAMRVIGTFFTSLVCRGK